MFHHHALIQAGPRWARAELCHHPHGTSTREGFGQQQPGLCRGRVPLRSPRSPQGPGTASTRQGLGCPPALPSLKDQHMESVPNSHPCAQQRFPFEGILRLCPNRRLRGAAFSLAWNKKTTQSSIRRDPQEFLPGSASLVPTGKVSLHSQGVIPAQPVPSTEPPSLLPWRNWLDAILRRAGWNSLQIAILSQSAAARSNCASRKSVIGISFYFILFCLVFFLENERVCGKGLFWMRFSIWKKKKKKKIGHNDQSGLF